VSSDTKLTILYLESTGSGTVCTADGVVVVFVLFTALHHISNTDTIHTGTFTNRIGVATANLATPKAIAVTVSTEMCTIVDARRLDNLVQTLTDS